MQASQYTITVYDNIIRVSEHTFRDIGVGTLKNQKIFEHLETKVILWELLMKIGIPFGNS